MLNPCVAIRTKMNSERVGQGVQLCARMPLYLSGGRIMPTARACLLRGRYPGAGPDWTSLVFGRRLHSAATGTTASHLPSLKDQ